MDHGGGAENGRLQDVLHREMAPRRGRLRAAQRARLRRDEVLRHLPSQRLHLRRPTWFPAMPDELRTMFNKVTKGMMSGNAGEVAKEEFKVNGQYVDKPGQPITI